MSKLVGGKWYPGIRGSGTWVGGEVWFPQYNGWAKLVVLGVYEMWSAWSALYWPTSWVWWRSWRIWERPCPVKELDTEYWFEVVS